jgi:serine/threonine protein kinase
MTCHHLSTPTLNGNDNKNCKKTISYFVLLFLFRLHIWIIYYVSKREAQKITLNKFYFIIGREKLLIYEYMERGDLHQWLHELPAGTPNTEEWDDDTLEVSGNWPIRHHIALGIARGLAFLHQGWAGSGRPVTHGHLVLANILLGDDLEPRIADISIDNASAPEGDVYQFGVILFELMTCWTGWNDALVNRVRGLVKEGKELDLLDERLLIEGVEPDWQRQMASCLHVGYLCTAQSPEKRPTMQQVVGLVKDARPAPIAISSAVS